MRILVTNDDGIHAHGLKVMEQIARELSDDVWVIAPETDQSGVSHSLTLSDPLRLREVSERHFAVQGTPTDCVIMGVRHVMDTKPDLVLSGVNRGQNIADDISYSGTVAGAIEGTVLGIRSIACSQAYSYDTRDRPHWETAQTHGAQTIQNILDADWEGKTLINVNFPDALPDDVKGTVLTEQGRRNVDFLDIDARQDGRGRDYYWIAFRRDRPKPQDGSDLRAVMDGYISVTPITLDRTDHATLKSLKAQGL